MFLVAAVLSLALQQVPPTTPVPDVSVTEAPISPEERAAAEEEARQNEVVCRREHVLGSNRPQRVCQTRRQWEGLRDRSIQSMNDGNSRVGAGSGGDVGSGAQ